jgi:hypothetical protein
MWSLPELAGGRIGLFVKLHHAIADGMAARMTVAAFLDGVPDAPAASARPWTPAPCRRHMNSSQTTWCGKAWPIGASAGVGDRFCPADHDEHEGQGRRPRELAWWFQGRSALSAYPARPHIEGGGYQRAMRDDPE